MEVLDLTPQYLVGFCRDQDRISYENSFPKLFEHYYGYWASRERPLFRVSADELQGRKTMIESQLSKLSGRLVDLGVSLDRVRVVYFVGVGTTNGHAFEHDGKFHVWLPLETYSTVKRTAVFVAHELVHALHYRECPAFYFCSKTEQIQLARQLITEGVATFLTTQLLRVTEIEALWADYLSEEDAGRWWNACLAEEEKLNRVLAGQFRNSDPEVGLFYADDPTDIYRYRAGYFAGLRLVAKFALSRGLTARDMLQVRRPEFERGVFAMLA